MMAKELRNCILEKFKMNKGETNKWGINENEKQEERNK